MTMQKPGVNRASAQGGQPGSQIHYSTNKSGKGTPIYAGSKPVGTVADGVFKKRICGSKHLLRQPPAIAFDLQSLKDAEAAGAMWVEVTDAESGRVYRAAMAAIWAEGKPFNRGHGPQWYLALGYWNRPAVSPAQLRLI